MSVPSVTPSELAYVCTIFSISGELLNLAERRAAHHALALSNVADFDERVPLYLAVAAKSRFHCAITSRPLPHRYFADCTEGILQTASVIARHRERTVRAPLSLGSELST